MVPKGKIMLIGGAEDRLGSGPADESLADSRFEILSQLLPPSRSDGRIEVLTCASGVPKEITETYERTFGEIGFGNVGFLHAEDRPGASAQAWSKRLADADAVFLTGGDQGKLAAILGGSGAWDTIEEKYRAQKGFTVAGTSAGAMVLSSTMIMGGGNGDGLKGEQIRLGPGLGLIDHCVVDTHFVERGRFARLAHSLLLNPRSLGIGLGEDSAVLVESGRNARCLGTGMVVLMDCTGVGHTNVADAGPTEAIYALGLKVSLLVKGCTLDLRNREPQCKINQK